MYNLYYFTSADFYMDKSTSEKGGNVLCIDSNGITFVCFHVDAERCTFCGEAVPEFKKLPQRIGNCKFGLVNLNTNRNIVQLSRQTILPIETVPMFVLYVNGRPFMKYTGSRTFEEMTMFIQDVTNKMQKTASFMEQKKLKVESDIPPFSVGIPYSVVCDEDKGVCYLDWGSAYNVNPRQAASQPQQRQRPPQQQQPHY